LIVWSANQQKSHTSTTILYNSSGINELTNTFIEEHSCDQYNDNPTSRFGGAWKNVEINSRSTDKINRTAAKTLNIILIVMILNNNL